MLEGNKAAPAAVGSLWFWAVYSHIEIGKQQKHGFQHQIPRIHQSLVWLWIILLWDGGDESTGICLCHSSGVHVVGVRNYGARERKRGLKCARRREDQCEARRKG